MKLTRIIPFIALLGLVFNAYAVTVNNVTASGYDEKNGHKPEYAIDGNLSTRWAAQGNETWIAIEFDKVEDIQNIVIKPFKPAERSLSFTISYSDNGKKWTDMDGKYQTALIDSKLGEKFVFVKPIKAKYIRLNTLGTNINTWSAILELDFNSGEALPSQSVQ